MAAKDVYHQFAGSIDTPEKFEAQRWNMASRVWAKIKATDSRECRGCHDYRTMDLENQASLARKKHARAMKKGRTCIDCHAGIAHKQPEPPLVESVRSKRNGAGRPFRFFYRNELTGYASGRYSLCSLFPLNRLIHKLLFPTTQDFNRGLINFDVRHKTI